MDARTSDLGITNCRSDAHPSWRTFSRIFIVTFFLIVGGSYLFVALLDPYDDVSFHLPIKRPIMSISQRYMYPQIVRSGRYDSLIVGTSTSRLLDPEILNGPLHARLANLAMDSATAWEQSRIVEYFAHKAAAPKVLIIGVDWVWCDQNADRDRITFRGFPDWLYDDNPWNDFLYFLNMETVEIAARIVGYHLGLHPERVRQDGYEVFVPPESEYDLARARMHIWGGRQPIASAPLPPPNLSKQERDSLQFPALAWLDKSLSRSASSTKIIAFMPVHVAAQPVPGSVAAAVEDECKARIATIGRSHGAKVIDWRISSRITTRDENYWDNLHFRVPVAQKLARELATAIGQGADSPDYHMLVR